MHTIVNVNRKDPRAVVVTMEAATQDELQTMEAQNAAIDEANLYNGGLDMNGSGIYAVDAEGVELEDPFKPGVNVSKWRRDMRVLKGL